MSGRTAKKDGAESLFISDADRVESSSVFPSVKQRVSPGKLADELTRIRREAAALDAERELAATGKAAPRVRATLSNFIVVSVDMYQPDRARRLNNLIESLCVIHPSRFFLVDFDVNWPWAKAGEQGEADFFEAQVSSRCVLARSGMHVCSEEVLIRVGSPGVSSMANLLLSLLVPDIATVVMVFCDPEADIIDAGQKRAFFQLLSLFEGISSRLLYDSRSFDNYGASAGGVMSCRAWHSERQHSSFGKPRDVSVSVLDLNWLRLAPWCRRMAERFEERMLSCRPEDVFRVEIRYEDPSAAGRVPASVFLMAGWILAAFGWKLGEAERDAVEREYRVACLTAENKIAALHLKANGFAAGDREFSTITDCRILFGADPGAADNVYSLFGEAFQEREFYQPFETLVSQALVSDGLEQFFAQVLDQSLKLAQRVKKLPGDPVEKQP